MAPHSSTLAWKIPWTEEPGRLQTMGSQRVGHDWATSLSLFPFMHWRRNWQPTPVFLPGESQGWGAWWATIYGVAQSQAWLKQLSSSGSRSGTQTACLLGCASIFVLSQWSYDVEASMGRVPFCPWVWSVLSGNSCCCIFFLHPIWFSDIIHVGCSGSSGRIHSAIHNLYHTCKRLVEAV